VLLHFPSAAAAAASSLRSADIDRKRDLVQRPFALRSFFFFFFVLGRFLRGLLTKRKGSDRTEISRFIQMIYAIYFVARRQ
jgi:hypothetical protein